MKHLAILTTLLLPVAAWAQRTPLSNNSQPITAAPSIPNRTVRHRDRAGGAPAAHPQASERDLPMGLEFVRLVLREAKILGGID